MNHKQRWTWKYWALVGLLCLPTSAVWAQNTHAGMNMERMAQALHLTDEQREKVKVSMGDSREEMHQIREAMQQKNMRLKKLNPSEKGYREKVKHLAHAMGVLMEKKTILNARMRASLYSILSDEQREIAVKLQNHHSHIHPRDGVKK